MPVTAVAGQTAATDLIGVYGKKEEKDEGPDNSMGKDAFLKLLVAQLKYQDPMNPSKSEDFIATTAQFTMVEKLDELTELTRSNAATDSLTTASALIGKEVTVTGPDGEPQTSIVRRTQLIGGEVMVITDLGTVALNQIIGIGAVGSSQAKNSPVVKTDPVTDTVPATDTVPEATADPVTEATTDPTTDPDTTIDTAIDTTIDTSTDGTDGDSTETTQGATTQDLPTETTGTDATEPVTTAIQDPANRDPVTTSDPVTNQDISSNPQTVPTSTVSPTPAPVVEDDDAATVTITPISTEES